MRNDKWKINPSVAATETGPLTPLLLRRQLDGRAFAGIELFDILHPFRVHPTLQQSHTPIPAQNRFIVIWRPDLFSSLEIFHCLFKNWQHGVRWTAGAKLCLRFSLLENAEVIAALIFTCQSTKHALSFGIAIRDLTSKLIRDGESQETQSGLIGRIFRKYVAANGFRLTWFV